MSFSTEQGLKDHLIGRGMEVDRYRVSFDPVEEHISFLLFNLSGQVVGFQKYRPGMDQKKKRNDETHGRYFTYTQKNKTSDGTAALDGIWGFEAIDMPVYPTDKPLYIVEGVFKAAALHRLGYDSLAVLTSHPKRLRTWLRIVKEHRPVIAIGDPDEGGKKLVRFVGAGSVSPKDLDEMSDNDIHEFLKELD